MKLRLRDAGKYLGFLLELRRYGKMAGAEDVSWGDLYPCLGDRTATTSFDTHYFYQDIWAFTRIHSSGIPLHVDVGSNVVYVGFLTAVTQVEFVDIRPLVAPGLKNFKSLRGSVLDMPYETDSVPSLSCLHVAEHIGLGRYGDPLDPGGTKKAAVELARCLARGGNLYFSLPVGRPRLCFNAHRIHSPAQILDYFADLKLLEFSLCDDQKNFIENTSPEAAVEAKYACGMFRFTKA